MRARVIVLAVVAATAVAACGGGPSCEDAVGNAVKLMGYGGAGYGSLKAQAVKKCTDEKWPDELRACVVRAADKRALDACESLARKDRGSLDQARRYVEKSKRIEAELMLNSLGRRLKTAYLERDALPQGTAPLTPATPCCAGTGDKCPVDVASWQAHPVWTELDFAIEDPHYFQYAYEALGPTKARALAVGDMDCDGTTITYVLEATVGMGGVEVVVTKPTNDD